MSQYEEKKPIENWSLGLEDQFELSLTRGFVPHLVWGHKVANMKEKSDTI